MGCGIKKIGWKVSGLSPDLASVRYRAILPLLALEKVGIQSSIIPMVTDIDLADFCAIIIVKSFTPDDLYLAQQACVKKIPVFFDLCDNIFIGDYKGKQTVTPAEMFFAMSPYLAGVFVTTTPLKTVVEGVIPGSVPVFVVPDGVETKRDVDRAKKILNSAIKSEIKKNIRSVATLLKASSISSIRSGEQKLKLAKHHIKANIKSYLKPLTWIKKSYTAYDHARSVFTGKPRKSGKSFKFFSDDTFLAGNPIKKASINKNSKRILWFGNHGAKYAQFGMLDLLSIRVAIEKLNKEFPIELIVVSNNREKFVKYISRFDCVTRYLEWSSETVDAMLDIADAVVVPNSKDPFSICKSSNRTVMALNANVPVVADLTPALDDLREAIYTDDFYTGLKQCFTDFKEVKYKIALGKEKIREKYGKNAIAEIFLAAFAEINNVSAPVILPNTNIVVLHLVQDFELARPLIDRLKSVAAPYFVWISYSLARKAPKVLCYMRTQGVPYFCLPDDIGVLGPTFFSWGAIKTLITMAETNLGPHKFTHLLTKNANDMGVRTYTLQHGFENVGLTYSDSVHDINKITIAAKNVLIWGEASTLHPQVSVDLKEKIISVGCPKIVGVADENSTPLDLIDKKIIGIFENLHWHRYSEKYRDSFLNALDLCAAKYPQVIFFVKPHPAGMWLTSRYKGSLPAAENIIIANPMSSEWERYSINAFWHKINGVISTPSTVVLDAVRENIPTLVCGFDLPLPNYQPLPIAVDSGDWFAFIDAIVSESTEAFTFVNSSFARNTLVEGDAAGKIINLLLAS